MKAKIRRSTTKCAFILVGIFLTLSAALFNFSKGFYAYAYISEGYNVFVSDLQGSSEDDNLMVSWPLWFLYVLVILCVPKEKPLLICAFSSVFILVQLKMLSLIVTTPAHHLIFDTVFRAMNWPLMLWSVLYAILVAQTALLLRKHFN